MYLLDTPVVLQLVSRNKDLPVFAWLESAKPDQDSVFVSVISMGQIQNDIEALGPQSRNHWRRLYQEGRQLLNDRHRLIEVDLAIVDVWQAELRGAHLQDVEDAGESLGEDDRLVIATAIARGYTLVCEGSRTLSQIADRTTLALAEL